MARPLGRLPKDQSKLVPATIKELIPISQFGCGNSWEPTSITEVVQCLYVNDKLDKGSAIKFRVLWSSGSSTTTDSATFKILYSKITAESTTLTGLAATALDTAIAADTVVGANLLQYSPSGTIAASTITDGDSLILGLSVSALSGLSLDGTAAKQVVVYGVEIEYVTTYIS